MRKELSIKNAIISACATTINLLFAFISQRILIKYLGIEYQGINGLFTNIISMLSIVELGIGPAIAYNLYKPVADNDKEKIKSLLKFYKKSYLIIAIIITLIGLLLLPFLNVIVGTTSISNIELLFVLFLIDTIASYLLTYKRSILYANQKNYVVNIIHIGYIIVLNISQILMLIFTKNFILFLLIKIICRILENIVVSHVAGRLYSYIKSKEIQPLDIEIRKDIFKKVKGLLLHKISTFIVVGTDNLLMSSFFGLKTVGIYTNYNTVISAATMLISQGFTSITATIGNLLVTEKKEKSHDIYLKLEFLNFWVHSLVAIGFWCCIQPFINAWIGEGYLFNNYILFAISFNLFISGMRNNTNIFKDAAGIYHEDRFVPIFESLINIVASLIFIKLYGVIGIIMGTTVSTAVIFLYSYPKYVYNKLFNRPKKEYIRMLFKYFVIHLITLIITTVVTKLVILDNYILEVLKNVIIVLLVVNIIYIVLFRKKEEYKYFKEFIMSKIIGFLHKTK